MNAEYWKLPDIIKNELEPLYDALNKKVGDKVNDIKYRYGKPLNASQQRYLAKDEELLNTYNEFIQHLFLKISFLLKEHETLNVMLAREFERNSELTIDLFALAKEKAELLNQINQIKSQYDKF